MSKPVPAVPGFKPPKPPRKPQEPGTADLLRSMKSDAGWELVTAIANGLITEAQENFFKTEEGSIEEREFKYRRRFYKEFWDTLNTIINKTVALSGQNQGKVV